MPKTDKAEGTVAQLVSALGFRKDGSASLDIVPWSAENTVGHLVGLFVVCAVCCCVTVLLSP